MKLNPLIASAVALLLLLAPALQSQPRTWVCFRDKAFSTVDQLQQALRLEETRLLPATRTRLQKVRSESDLLGEADLPVCPRYLDEIERLTGLKPRVLSRTLNAASYALTEQQITLIKSLPFVRELQPVRQFLSDPEPDPNSKITKTGYRSIQDSLWYGPSYLQNALENFPPAHEENYTGAGVFMGFLDAGWNNLEHVCFDSLEVVATWDFVNNDPIVDDEPGQQGNGAHGTFTLSCIAGYDPGQLIGTAYGVSVALAKTENTDSELPVEEDLWVAGLEWLDSLGCVIVSSSVSYYNFDVDPAGTSQPQSYTYEDLDGDTAPTTIAADYAVARGIVVLNSMGNRGTGTYPENKMKVPADGDSILSIGSVDSDSMRSWSSSMGPTYDGRIKPDLMALGGIVLVADTGSTTGYMYRSGTSFSTPITAGACALILQADPSLTPMQVHTFLKATGDQALNPDTLRGWGVYNVWQAVQDVINAAAVKTYSQIPSRIEVLQVYPNPFNPAAKIAFTLPAPGAIHLEAFDLNGRRVAGIASGYYSAGTHFVDWNTMGLGSGNYFLRLTGSGGVQVQRAVVVK